MRTLVFNDLVRYEGSLAPHENAWLSALAAETTPERFVMSVGRSLAEADPGPLFQRDPDGVWRAGRYVGELRRQGQVVEVRPRLGVETIAAWIGAALNVRVVPRAAEAHGTTALITELMAAVWRSAFVEAGRHGPPGFRADLAHDGMYARGRLDVRRTSRLHAAGRPILASVERPKQLDNAVARVIVLADRVLDQRLGRPGWRGERVEELMQRLRPVVPARPALPSRRELHRVRYTPITLAYRRLAELSWQIARHRGIRTTARGESTEGVLIDVAELWELFLVHCARKAFGSADVKHGTRLASAGALLRSTRDDTTTLGRLYPDLLIARGGMPHAVVDAKYKPLREPRGVDPADLYQLNAYLTARPGSGAALGMLAYPRFDDGPAATAEARGPWSHPAGPTMRFERLPVDEAGCVAAMRSLLEH